jgi:hypothetical protein
VLSSTSTKSKSKSLPQKTLSSLVEPRLQGGQVGKLDCFLVLERDGLPDSPEEGHRIQILTLTFLKYDEAKIFFARGC